MKNIEPHNDKGQRHGYWEVYWTDGSIHSKSYWINDELLGYAEAHYIKDIVYFHL